MTEAVLDAPDPDAAADTSSSNSTVAGGAGSAVAQRLASLQPPMKPRSSSKSPDAGAAVVRESESPGPPSVNSSSSVSASVDSSTTPSIWRSRDYLSWWTGTTVSALGSTLSAIAFPLLMLYQTGSVAQAGAIAALENVGRLTTLLIGGVLADRFSRKALLVGAPMIQALAVGAVVPLVLTRHVSVYSLGAVAVVQGVVNGLSGGAMMPALKRIVPAEQFPAASASRQGRDMAAELVGPPIGGILFAAARWAPFVGDALSYLAAALGSGLIRTPLGPELGEDTPREPMRRQLAEGWRFIRSNDYMRFITTWIPVVNALFMVLFLLVLALIRHRGGGPVSVGTANAIAAIGGLTGAVCTPWLVRRIRSRTLVVAASWVLAAGVIAAAFVPHPWEIGAVFAAALVMAAPLYSVFETYQVKIVPDELYGRVSTLLTFLSVGLLWVAPIVAGLLADFFGPVTAQVVGGGVLAALAVWVQSAKSLHQLDEDR
ncbi:MAG TPA: MFS transporter [Actinocrinis sp.]|uniref:MFS transporter n=1 Tax=Actinocrinis sp. TaxID=1920516 RepID=UPI002DDCE7D5|nr:MFS transporter [Actinocrinis sp.]HEV2347220.1 MFS transporter [Actinocrinis sp.]